MPQFFIPDRQQLTINERDYSEAARYLGYHKISAPDETVSKLIHQAIQELLQVIKPQAVYEEFEVELGPDLVSFADLSIPSRDLARNLRDCSRLVIFALTLGPLVDSLIRRAQTKDPVMAAVLQASAAMLTEKCVDLLNDNIKKEAACKGYAAKPRFSPGYGDVSLEVQKDFFRLLPCKRIGLSLMDTLIMSPEKSVTAFVGLKKI